MLETCVKGCLILSCQFRQNLVSFLHLVLDVRSSFCPRKFRGNITAGKISRETLGLRLSQYSRSSSSVTVAVFAMVANDLMLKLLELIPEESVSVHQLTCKTGLDHRTIKKYLDLIIAIQESKKIRKEQVGLRVLVRREK